MIDLTIGEDRIAEIRFDAPGEKVNILSQASLARLAEVLSSLEAAAHKGDVRGATVTSAKGGVFLAGADVKAFVTVAQAGDAAAAAAKAREGQALFTRLAALPFPTVACINGVCLGGGLELALACTSRLASDGPEVSIGLPEVRLGLVPGWGGTQRLPRLIGLSRALDLILTGRSLTGRQARKLGLVDAVVPAEGIAGAGRAEALRLAQGARPRRPAWPLVDRLPGGSALSFAVARRGALKQTRGHYPAPMAAIETVRYGLTHGIRKGLRNESEQVGRLLVGEVSRHLVRIFLDSRGIGAAPRESAPAPAVSRVGVLGAGTMGGGIAAVAALSAGLPVRLKDVNAEALARGMKQVRAMAASSTRKGRHPRHEAERREALVAATTDLTGFAGCDLVIEAVVEDLDVKRQVLREIEALVSPAAIFATNTSSLSVAAIAAGAARPGRVIGLHFFNPVEKMPLVEVVRAPATDESAVEAAVAVARRMGKTPVVVKDTPGFIVNRILMPYMAAAVDLLAAAGDPGVMKRIDSAMVRFGMPMGPFALLDQIGLDVAARVSGVFRQAFPDRVSDSRLLDAMAQAGLLGVKSAKGFYQYRGRGAKARPTAPAAGLAPLLAGTYRGPAHPAPADDQITDLLVDPMVNEAALLLGEGAVDQPGTIDLAMVFGTGFPPFRGGLLRHADAVGKDVIAARLERRGAAVAPLLRADGRFYA